MKLMNCSINMKLPCLWKTPNHHLKVGSTLFQRCGSRLKYRWSDVENETKSEAGFSAFYNIDTKSMFDVKTTLNQRCSALMQPFFNVAQRLFNVVFNVDMTLSQLCLNVESTAVKTLSKPIWPVKSIDSQKDWLVIL